MKTLIFNTHKVTAAEFAGIVLGTVAAIGILLLIINACTHGIQSTSVI